ncbi:YceI family protein [Psychroserpens sp.]|uniref:YceI family protein n=1 Tax=Psychroserpens sp. TaxID=2020870 RepID=UPI001B17F7DC|nr:YceI family protein [Psychroserpens sp.]MBO6605295.1 YceI family protein [Psychroserpens sp.]MBO6631725.1 YceI family protein [Psychroserpens sp.]MBO6653896.1 YceI family protein [Psychroserpens sp.]MBO6682217.1 YceI family protein [Psychroserpens sp.]MBO6748669.1 YceI family protein [Psychroserpens sp.]
MKKKILLLLVGIISSCTFLTAQEKETYVAVDFKIKNLGINVDGRFNTASITTNFTNEDYKQWYLEGHVVVNTIDTDNSARDEHLLESDYFDATKFPKITLQSKSFERINDTTYDVMVDLTIKGIKKTLKIPVQIVGNKESFNLKSKFEINRKDFDVGGSSFILSSKVKISVNYKFNY